MINSNIIENASSTSKINAKVELYSGSTLVETCTCNDRLQDFTVERAGQSNKFFGFGVTHRLTVTLIDLERTLEITQDNSFKVYFGYDVEEEFVNPCPTFYASEIKRDENTNSITVVAYDKLYATNAATVADLALEAPYTIRDVAHTCSNALGIEAVCGKNLWKNSDYITTVPDEYITRTNTGFTFVRSDLSGGRAVHYSIPVKAGETYTFSYDSVLTGEGARLIIYLTEAYGTVLAQERDLPFLTYTFEEDITAVFTIVINSTVLSLEASNIQVEKSATRTTYEPYLAAFDINYETGANFEGTESCKDTLTAIAEATQTIFYVNHEDKLIFKRINNDSVLTIGKNDYYSLETGEVQTLTGIANVTELGDNIEMSTGAGFTQYVRNNPFLELRADITTMLTTALASVGGMTIVPFICEWDGNFLLEAGDMIKLITEDDQEVTSIVANDIVTYNGIFSEVTQWTTEAREETATNPTSLGEVLKQTYAKVDKANKEITLVASSVETNKQDIASLTIDINGIKLAIESLEDATIGDFTDLTTRLAALELSNTEIKATVAENKTTVEALDGEVDALGTEVHTNTASIGVLSGTVETHSTKIGELSTSNTKISASVSSLETTTTTLNNKFGVIETDVKTIDGIVSALDEDLTALDDEVSRVDGVVTVNTEKIAALELNDESITASVTAVTERTTAIESHMGELDENLVLTQESIAALQIKDNEITASVSTVEKTTNERIDGVEENYSNISEQMSELKLTDSALTLEITNIKNDGVSKVSGIGFSFDMNGLTIDKEDSELSTNIDEDGLSVYRNQEEVLTADNSGVKAYNLHATTYLTIGDRGDGEGRSKFADYGTDRTGCFWVGK